MNYLVVILLPIVLMGGVGSLQNEMVNSGFSNSVNLTCPGWPNVTCQDNAAVACANSTYTSSCSLSGTSISFLNGKSPFTPLIQGNLPALFTGLTGPGTNTASGAVTTPLWGQTHYPFDVTGNSLYVSVNCSGKSLIGPSQKNWAIGNCTQTGTDYKNVTEVQATTWGNWNTIQSNANIKLQLYHLGNGTFPMSCSFIAQINYTAVANGPGYTYYGCDIGTPADNTITDPQWGLLVAMPVSYGPPGTAYSHQFIFAQVENWHTQNCLPNLNMGAFGSQSCNNFLAAFTGYVIPGTSTSFVPSSAGAAVAGFLIGLVLLCLGLGIQFGLGGGVSVGVNSQATRLAEGLGIGLIVFSFMYSEFGGWFTAGNVLDVLPNGLDFVMLIIVAGAFFFGIFGLSIGGVSEGS